MDKEYRNEDEIKETDWDSIFESFTKQRILEELIYGSIAGFFICIGGHPFE